MVWEYKHCVLVDFSRYRGEKVDKDKCDKTRGIVTCETKLCCRATAKLAEEVSGDLKLKDKSLAELLEGQADEDKDTEQ